MIKKLIVAAVMVLGACGANAATKCVKLDADAYMWVGILVGDVENPDWAVEETDGTIIRGVGVCSDQVGVVGTVSQTITVGTTNEYCWCKMFVPAVSQWVSTGYVDPDYYVGGCARNCGYQCAQMMIGGHAPYAVAANRQAMFGSIGG